MCYILLLKLALESNNACSVCVPLIMECRKSAPSANQPSWIMRIRLPRAVTSYIITLKGLWSVKISLYYINNVMIYSKYICQQVHITG